MSASDRRCRPSLRGSAIKCGIASTDPSVQGDCTAAYRRRHGQISFMSSEDFPSDEDSSDPDYLRSSLPPVQDPSPDVTSIESNDVKQQILLDSGRWAATKQTQYSIPTLTHLIQRREIGMDTHQHFSAGNCCLINSRANDGCLYVYDRESNQRTLKIEAHDDDVNAVCFADSSSQILYSGSDDGLCKVWDRRTLREDSPLPVGVMGGHYDGITFIDSKGDARYFVSNSKDQTIKLWDMRVFSSKDGIEATKKAVSGQRWDYRWQQVPKRMTKKRRLGGDTSVMTYRGHSVLHTLIRCRFSPAFTTGQRYIYTGCSTGSIVVYDVLTGKVVRNLEGGHKSCVRDISWHPYQHTIISSSSHMQKFLQQQQQMVDCDDNLSHDLTYGDWLHNMCRLDCCVDKH
ncbi:hypothetical protein C0Q70_18516 [Pomacea canaliculata]|uniref:Uncharacterized protein n=1 Tax=Pomacea canaliculata TaxID=400727 RepID=A0A2T7NGU9_POMCA|nr:hypothetical protein C0Q70_18516 [Pomacea canaliculata]